MLGAMTLRGEIIESSKHFLAVVVSMLIEWRRRRPLGALLLAVGVWFLL